MTSKVTSGTSGVRPSGPTIVGMTTYSTSYADRTPRALARRLLQTRLGRFLTAYLEMTLAMVVGMGVLGVVWDAAWPGLTGRPDVMALTMAFDMTVGMAAWMWVRRHARRHIAEMSAVMVLPFLVLLVPYWLGVLPGEQLLTWGHVGMFALMAAYLAWRPHTPGGATWPRSGDGVSPGSRTGRLSAVLLVTGAVLAVVGGILHPHEEPPNSHEAVFAEYAHSADWVWVHDLQFLSAAVVVAGLLTAGRALQRVGVPRTLVRSRRRGGGRHRGPHRREHGRGRRRPQAGGRRLGGRGPRVRASRFAAAEAVRWLEWGVNSFFAILLGVTLLTVAAGLLRQAHLGAQGTRVRLAGVTGALAGALLVVNGLTVGAHGFEPTALPLVASGLYVVMALGIPALDRAVGQAPEHRPLAGQPVSVV